MAKQSNNLRTSGQLLKGFGRRNQKQERESCWELQGEVTTVTTCGLLIPNTLHEGSKKEK